MTAPLSTQDCGTQVSLEAFLGALDPETAAELRAIAARIDALERVADGLAGIERRLMPWVGMAALLFLFGIGLILTAGIATAMTASLCLLALPVVAGVYAWQIKPRTQADSEAQALNRAHFLPHGCLYFPRGTQPACVVRVDWVPPPPQPAQTPSHLRDPRKPENRIGSSW